MQTEVLDIQRYPEITFVAHAAEPSGSSQFLVKGDLTIHGVTNPIELPVTAANNRYIGTTRIKQTDFGITPVKIAGGAVKVKDEIQISFEIVI